MKTAQQALDSLIAGNRRFVAGLQDQSVENAVARRYRLVARQQPSAIIIGCSDARVPAEIVFDQDLGELFVVRVAGNVVLPAQIGSVEFAAEKFGTSLVVVLGHSRCGAVEATLEILRQPDEARSPNLNSIVDCIRPAVEGLLKTDLVDEPEQLVERAVRANIRASVEQLRRGSPILEKLIDDGKLTVIGAEYSLDTGAVEFFDQAG